MARPELLIVARAVSEELQVAEEVISAVLPSLNVPVALNCAVFPGVTLGFAGVNAIDTKVGGGAITISIVEPVRRCVPWLVAVMVVKPGFSALASPPELMVAIVVSDELHVTFALRSTTVPSR